MDIKPEEPIGGDVARTQSQQDANSAMEAFMLAIQRFGAGQARFADLPSTFEDALLSRLEALTAQLAPLKGLSPAVDPPSREVALELKELRMSMERPDWSHAKRLDPGCPPYTNPFTGAMASGPAQST